MKKNKNKVLQVYIFFMLIFTSFLMTLSSCQNERAAAKADNLKSNKKTIFIKMADSEIARKKDSLEYGKSDSKAKWNYQTGLFLKSLLDLWEYSGEHKYLNYTKKVIDSFLENDGSIKTYKKEDFNIDKINSGKVLLRLYSATNNITYKLAADRLREQLRDHPRTKDGGFWHKKIYPWQMWLDGIYMGSPFYAEYSEMFNQPAGFDDVINQILIIDVHTRDPKTRLRYHGWDESNMQKWADPETGCSPNFWGRAMGWYAMALIDVLDFIPENHPKRDQIIFILKDLYGAIAAYQDQESGLWYQVVDLPDKNGNYLEASASSMFVYAFAKAINNGFIDTSFIPVVLDGYNGIINNLIEITDNGLVSLTNICSVAGLGGDPYRDGSFKYYINEPIVSNDLKGVGPFIMAGIQVEKMKSKISN